MKETVLILMSAAKGHLNPSFGIARLFSQQGYAVVYAAPFQVHAYIFEQGFQSVSLEGYPFGINTEDILDYIGKSQRVKYFDNLIDRFYDTVFKFRKAAIERIIQQTKPSIIFLDSFQSTDFVVLYPLLKQRKIKFALIQTMTSFHQQSHSLPLNCGIIPNPKTNFNWYWNNYYLKRWLKTAWENVAFFGKSSKRIVQQKIKEQGIDGLYQSDDEQFKRIGFKNITEFIICPPAFEFTAQKQPYQYYLGLLVDLNRKEDTKHPLNLLLEKLPLNQAIIYCSFGTLYADYGKKKDILKFFKILLKTVTQFPERIFVVSLAEDFVKMLGVIPQNIHFFDTVPQLTALGRSSLFITHGGLNSIKESIALGVPMLVYPVDKNWDQRGNAAKVVYHGLGLKGELQQETTASLENKIKILLNDDSYKKRLSLFKNESPFSDNESLFNFMMTKSTMLS